jgi:hypothetical protein
VRKLIIKAKEKIEYLYRKQALNIVNHKYHEIAHSCHDLEALIKRPYVLASSQLRGRELLQTSIWFLLLFFFFAAIPERRLVSLVCFLVGPFIGLSKKYHLLVLSVGAVDG